MISLDMTRGLDEEKDSSARTGHEDRHVSWGGSSLLLLGGLGEPGLKRKDEGDPKEAWLTGSGISLFKQFTYQPIILYRSYR